MEVIGGLDTILVDQFKPYRVAKGNVASRLHTFLTLALPLVFGAAVGFCADWKIAAGAGTTVAVYAVLASVLTAIMPTIHSLIGMVDPKQLDTLKTGSITSDENLQNAKLAIAKVEVIRSLYAAVAWAVIVLVFSLVPVLILTINVFQEADPGLTFRAIRIMLAGTVAFAGATAFVALLQIVTGVHLMIRGNTDHLEESLTEIKSRYDL